jgi:dUTP pyrophosphatase
MKIAKYHSAKGSWYLPESHWQCDPDKVGLIWPRSGIAAKCGIDTGAGVIDSDYRGEVKVLLFNHGNVPFRINRSDRIAQLLIVPAYDQSIVVAYEFAEKTARGENGFGSTGR